MNGPELVGEALIEALRPLVVEIVHQEFEQRLAELQRCDDDLYLTTAEYAMRFKTTPGAVLASTTRRPAAGRCRL